MSHTPGPWTFDPEEDDCELYAHPINAPHEYLGETTVAVVGGARDAYLIAAAPDLLAACEACLSDRADAAGAHHPVQSYLRVSTLEKLRLAVAKAKGE